jgi:hypothetical protein
MTVMMLPVNHRGLPPRQVVRLCCTHSWLMGSRQFTNCTSDRSARTPEHPSHGRRMPVGPPLEAGGPQPRGSPRSGAARRRRPVARGPPGDRRLLALVGDQGATSGPVAERRRPVGEATTGRLGGATSAQPQRDHGPLVRDQIAGELPGVPVVAEAELRQDVRTVEADGHHLPADTPAPPSQPTVRPSRRGLHVPRIPHSPPHRGV